MSKSHLIYETVPVKSVLRTEKEEEQQNFVLCVIVFFFNLAESTA